MTNYAALFVKEGCENKILGLIYLLLNQEKYVFIEMKNNINS